MKELTLYLPQASALVAFSYLIYKAVFARDAHHTAKRLHSCRW